MVFETHRCFSVNDTYDGGIHRDRVFAANAWS